MPNSSPPVREQIAVPHGATADRRDVLEEPVAVLVPEDLVDLPEPVDVDDRDRDGAGTVELEGAPEELRHRGAVGEAGQRVRPGEPAVRLRGSPQPARHRPGDRAEQTPEHEQPAGEQRGRAARGVVDRGRDRRVGHVDLERAERTRGSTGHVHRDVDLDGAWPVRGRAVARVGVQAGEQPDRRSLDRLDDLVVGGAERSPPGEVRIEHDVALPVAQAESDDVAFPQQRLERIAQRVLLGDGRTVGERVTGQVRLHRRSGDGVGDRAPLGQAARVEIGAERAGEQHAEDEDRDQADGRVEAEQPEPGTLLEHVELSAPHPGALTGAGHARWRQNHANRPGSRPGSVAEGVGFEPTVGCPTMVFESRTGCPRVATQSRSTWSQALARLRGRVPSAPSTQFPCHGPCHGAARVRRGR